MYTLPMRARPGSALAPPQGFSSTRGIAWWLAVAGLMLPCAVAQADFPKLKLTMISQGVLDMPIGMTTAGDGSNRLFILEQRGKIRIFQGGSILPTPFLDITSKLVPQRVTGGGQPNFDERGMLGLAFHPDYATPGAPGEGLLYVFYSAPSPDAPGTATNPVDCMSVISEFRVSAGNMNQADPGYERVLLTFNKPQFNHNGGQLAFGPDGFLYISTGDGGGADDNEGGHTGGSSAKPSGVLGNAQDLTRPLGKILRIDPLGTDGPGGQYGIPATNPFKGQGGGVREEIYAYGLRNPWRFSFDDGPGGTGRLFVADVGQRFYEEVNIVQSGGNYGWRVREGLHPFDLTTPSPGPFEDPIIEYSHPNSPDGVNKIGISTTGGFIYRGSAIPALRGKYVFGDWSTSFATPNGHLLGLEDTGSAWELSMLDVVGGNPIPYFINSFGEDEAGELYLLGNTRNAPSLPDLNTGLPAGVLFKIEAEPPILGFVDTFSSPGTNLWTGGSAITNPGTGGVDGDGDGFLQIANSFSFNFGARSASANYQGDWMAAGITELSLYLNDIGTDDPFEIHVLISDCALCTTWQYNIGFDPPNGCWERFTVDLTDSSKWTRTRGFDSLETVLQNVDRVTIRHDLAPYVDSPDPILGDLGVDNITLGPVLATTACSDPFADADQDGDVDQEDFGLFQTCFSGSCDLRPAACACFDQNADGHVDADDVEAFVLCISGPSIPADPGCDG